MRSSGIARRWLAGALLTAAVPVAARAAAPCEPIGTVEAAVSLQPPADAKVVGLKIRMEYPSGLDLPGDADESTVKERVQPLPGGLLYSPNDTDGTLIVALVGTAPIPAGPLLAVRFDRCKGALAPADADLHCTIEQASDDKGGLIAKGVTCAVALQARKEKGK